MALQTPQGELKLIVYLGVRREGRLLLLDYELPPNPDKPGWWIPAPEVGYGGDPLERVTEAAAALGFAQARPRLFDVESFTMGGGNWHVLVHYLLDVQADASPGPDVRRWMWATADELPEAADFAHKRWELELARRLLAA